MSGLTLLLLELGYDFRFLNLEFKSSVQYLLDALDKSSEIDSPRVIISTRQFLAYGNVNTKSGQRR